MFANFDGKKKNKSKLFDLFSICTCLDGSEDWCLVPFVRLGNPK
jgi:hypothetical protein